MDDPSQFRSSFSKREPLYLVFKRKNQILSIFLTTSLLVLVASYLLPRVYVASSTVFVERQIPPFAATEGRSFGVLDRKEVLNSEVEFITSRAVAETVADQLLAEQARSGKRISIFRSFRDRFRGFMESLGLVDLVHDEREGTIGFVQSKIEAEPALQSNVIRISITASDPQFAANVVNAVTNTYLAERLQLLKRPGLDEFYQEHIERSRRALDDLEERSRLLKESAGIVSVNEEIALKLEELSNLDTQLAEVMSEESELRERAASLREQLRDEPQTITALRTVQQNPTVLELQQKLVDLELQKAQELNRFEPGSPPILDIENSIRRIEESISGEPAKVLQSETTSHSSIHAGLRTELYKTEADYTAKQASEITLRSRIGALKAELQELSPRALELNRLSGSIDSAERIYYNYIEKREEARIEERTDPSTTNVRLVQEAAVPSKPLYSRLTLISLGGAMGLLLGFGLAFAIEFFDHSLATREDIERYLGLPLLASLPESETIRVPLLSAGVTDRAP